MAWLGYFGLIGAPTLATVIALSVGFRAVLLLGAALYLAAAALTFGVLKNRYAVS